MTNTSKTSKRRKTSTRSKRNKTSKTSTIDKRVKSIKHGNHSHKIAKTYKKDKCAPNPEKVGEFTCYTSKTLYKMKDLWNIRHPDCKITSDSPKKIWEELRNYIGDVCSRESCWLKQKFIENHAGTQLMNYTFAPKRPKTWKKNPNTWLNSNDILAVMKQYEKYYRCFEFIGPSPIDYDTHMYEGECVWKELCEFSLKDQIKSGKTKIGMIFNTDPHYKGGSHWFACFIHIPKRKLYYFDSYGEKAHQQILKLFKNIREQGYKLNMDFKEVHNTLRHQYSDSECGMYSLYFIIEMLKDKDPEHFLSHRIRDDEVERLRKHYYN